jgi:hypothetical protein
MRTGRFSRKWKNQEAISHLQFLPWIMQALYQGGDGDVFIDFDHSVLL